MLFCTIFFKLIESPTLYVIPGISYVEHDWCSVMLKGLNVALIEQAMVELLITWDVTKPSPWIRMWIKITPLSCHTEALSITYELDLTSFTVLMRGGGV